MYENEVEVEQFVRSLLVAMVSRPNEIAIERIYNEGDDGEAPLVELQIKVSPEDAGQVIGKQGRTARSLRTIVGVMAKRRNIRVVLNFCKTAKADQEMALAAAD